MIVVISAVHNRAAVTAQMLEGIQRQSMFSKMRICVVIVDDGSSDGTALLLRKSPVVTKIITGDGTWFWAKSMAAAEIEAWKLIKDEKSIERSFILWLNDDVKLNHDAFESALLVSDRQPMGIVVGKTRFEDRGNVSYGPLYRRGIHPLSFDLRRKQSVDEYPDTFNGNFVLVPFEVSKRLEGIDGRFAHAMADIDYGIRAKKIGIPITSIENFVGRCDRNEPKVFKRRRDAWLEFTSARGAGNSASMRLLLSRTTRLWYLWQAITYALWWLRRMASNGGFKA